MYSWCQIPDPAIRIMLARQIFNNLRISIYVEAAVITFFQAVLDI